jgi:endo-alpha-1,4-polygalactosaminidase (GH114 family)
VCGVWMTMVSHDVVYDGAYLDIIDAFEYFENIE